MIMFTRKQALISLAVVSLFCNPAHGQVTINEVQKLVSVDAEEHDNFGVSVAIDKDTAVIGADGEDDSGLLANGAAYVFTRSGGTWTERARLLASDKASGDRFGTAVALEGNTALVGAGGETHGGTWNNGASYVFTRSGGVWTEQAKLLASDK